MGCYGNFKGFYNCGYWRNRCKPYSLRNCISSKKKEIRKLLQQKTLFRLEGRLVLRWQILKNERFVNFRYVLVAEYEQNVNFEKMGYSKWHFFLLYNRGVYNFIWKWGIKAGPKCRYIRRINKKSKKILM